MSHWKPNQGLIRKFNRIIETMVPSKSEQDIIIQVTRNFKDTNISLQKLKKIVETFCRRFGTNENSNPPGKVNKYEISIAIVDDTEFRKINHQFLKRNYISDCLSFDLSDDNEPDSPKTLELVMNGEIALRQANLREHTVEAELALYVIHGLLHNFGFNDLEPAMAKKMHKTEDEILQQLGYGLVYNKRIDTQKQKIKKK